MNKQIEEMAKDICISRCGEGAVCDICPHIDNSCMYHEIAVSLYEKGYRKQREGE